ncbi:UNVERIFIED_CONTAM: T-cell immunomodulatory protein, partial [Siphonaria sp. JEL0065]
MKFKVDVKDLLSGSDETIDVNAMPLRLGDYDKDGYPDILMLTHDKSKSYIRLLQSIPCTKTLCSKTEVLDHHRYYKLATTGMDEINNMDGIKIGAVFFDLNEDGALDLFVLTKDKSGSKKQQHVSAFQNNFYSDGFFLKSLVLNGVCPAWCKNGVRFPDPKPYGVNYFGATIKYTVTDPNGQKRATQLSQIPQSSYFSLNLPYTVSGLGRTNNYIETLFVGVTKQKSDNVATYFGVIPNSQLVIVPYEPDSDGPDEWKLELFINPSTLAPWVFVSLLTTLVGLSGVVVFLHYRER